MNRTTQQTQQQIMENDAAALAAEMFDHFCSATTMRQIFGLHRNMCDTINLRPGPLNEFYPKLKSKVKNWKAQALWKKFDARASHRVYNKGTAAQGIRVLVIGAGPCGLRAAIEAQLLGAKVVVVEKRDRISRNNVLHLWPFLITDLRNLGAKKFYGKFCAGAIDHISIRQLQCILLKVALLLGVEIHEGISFIKTIEPSDDCGWRAQITPEDHAVSHYEFDVLLGADGKRNTLNGFRRKEFRGKLAIAITANFINKKTEAEARVEEISGVAFIFNQSFFKELYHTTGIDLENIVYYKDETHYFVMTAKKHSLLDKGVIIQDYADPAELLKPSNVNTEKLSEYAQEAAGFSTKYQMPNLEFAVNHYGKPDVAMFDFTSMFAAENSSRVTVRKNYRLLQCLVGDSLLEPFWPTGSGCARGFLSSMDAAYAIKLFANHSNSLLAVLAQRESIYRLLAQTTPENLQRDIGAYTLDPASRYPNLNRTAVSVYQVKNLLDSDDSTLLEQIFADTNILSAAIETPIRRKRRTGDTTPLGTVLLRWIKSQLMDHEFSHNLNEVSQCFTNGKVLCSLVNRYRPDLIDINDIQNLSAEECNDKAFNIFENEMGIPRAITPAESLTLEGIDTKIWLNYLEHVCEVFRGEIPHVKHPKLDFEELREKNKRGNVVDFSNLLKLQSKKATDNGQAQQPQQIQRRHFHYNQQQPIPQHNQGAEEWHHQRVRRSSAEHIVQAVPQDVPRRAKKRRTYDKSQNIEERAKRLAEIESNRNERHTKRREQRRRQTENFLTSLHMLQANQFLRDSDSSNAFDDYSLYVYRQSAPLFNDRVKELERKLLYPDRERGIPSAMPRSGLEDQFSDRIKSMEQRITGKHGVVMDKKPKDLLRAIGKIESNDWNVKEIEKKIEQSKKTEVGKNREKVPKWSREQFLARQNKMSKPLDTTDEKYKEIDTTIKALDKQLKDPVLFEKGRNKVASIAGQFVKKDDHEKSQPQQQQNADDKLNQIKQSNKVGLVFSNQNISEVCHFCKQRVYLMEKITTEGLVLHRSCLKCHHCHTNLRLGGYAFDRDNPQGLFFCTQHYRLPAKAKSTPKRPQPRPSGGRLTEHDGKAKLQDMPSTISDSVKCDLTKIDLRNRGQTPERIEFENADMSDGEPSLDNVIDENEWTDRNFGTGTDASESDITSSDSDSDDTDSDLFEEAIGSPLGQTLQIASDWIGKQRYIEESEDDDSYDSSDDEEADTQTEGEELAKARELRMQEVKLRPPLCATTTDTETEVVSVRTAINEACTNGNNLEVSNDNPNKCAIIEDNINSMEKITNKGNIDHNSKDDYIGNNIMNKINLSRENVNSYLNEDLNALNEKIYAMNHYLNVSKDIHALKKENLVKTDIMRKLSMKEEWLKSNSVNCLSPSNLSLDLSKSNESLRQKSLTLLNSCGSQGRLDMDGNVLDDFKNNKKCESLTNIKLGTNSNLVKLSKSNSIETNQSSVNDDELLFLDAITDEQLYPLNTPDVEDMSLHSLEIDDLKEKYSNRKLAKKLKDIEHKSFSETMDSIKTKVGGSKITTTDKIRDLSKFFPSQKQTKINSNEVNKNQKGLKDVDLKKYFASSSAAQRCSSNILASSKENLNNEATKPPLPKRNLLDRPVLRKQQSTPAPPPSRMFDDDNDMFDQLLDGAVDIPVHKTPSICKVSNKFKDDSIDMFDKMTNQILHSPSCDYTKMFDKLAVDIVNDNHCDQSVILENQTKSEKLFESNKILAIPEKKLVRKVKKVVRKKKVATPATISPPEQEIEPIIKRSQPKLAKIEPAYLEFGLFFENIYEMLERRVEEENRNKIDLKKCEITDENDLSSLILQNSKEDLIQDDDNAVNVIVDNLIEDTMVTIKHNHAIVNGILQEIIHDAMITINDDSGYDHLGKCALDEAKSNEDIVFNQLFGEMLDFSVHSENGQINEPQRKVEPPKEEVLVMYENISNVNRSSEEVVENPSITEVENQSMIPSNNLQLNSLQEKIVVEYENVEVPVSLQNSHKSPLKISSKKIKLLNVKNPNLTENVGSAKITAPVIHNSKELLFPPKCINGNMEQHAPPLNTKCKNLNHEEGNESIESPKIISEKRSLLNEKSSGNIFRPLTSEKEGKNQQLFQKSSQKEIGDGEQDNIKYTNTHNLERKEKKEVFPNNSEISKNLDLDALSEFNSVKNLNSTRKSSDENIDIDVLIDDPDVESDLKQSTRQVHVGAIIENLIKQTSIDSIEKTLDIQKECEEIKFKPITRLQEDLVATVIGNRKPKRLTQSFDDESLQVVETIESRAKKMIENRNRGIENSLLFRDFQGSPEKFLSSTCDEKRETNLIKNHHESNRVVFNKNIELIKEYVPVENKNEIMILVADTLEPIEVISPVKPERKKIKKNSAPNSPVPAVRHKHTHDKETLTEQTANTDESNTISSPSLSPDRPIRRKFLTPEQSTDETNALLERSRELHQKKQDFMKERIVGNNPYLKRMIKREEERQGSSPTNDVYSSSSNSFKSDKNNPRSMLDYFRKSPTSQRKSATKNINTSTKPKDSCIIS